VRTRRRTKPRRPLSTLSETLWTVVRWTVPITVAGVIAAAAVGTSRLGEEVRRRVEERLAGAFPTLDVQVQSAQLVEGEGIVIRGVSLAAPEMPASVRTLVQVDEIRLACGTSLPELASGSLRIDRVVLRRAVIHATRLAEGRWSVERLIGPAGGHAMPPPVVVEDATVLVEDAATSSRMAIRRVYAEITPDAATNGLVVQGTLAGDHFASGGFRGRIGMTDGGFDLEGDVASFELNESVLDAATTLGAAGAPRSASPPSSAASASPVVLPIEWARGFRGRVHCRWRVHGNRADLAATDVELAGRLEAGRYEHRSLPFAIGDISADFKAGRSGGQIENLQAHSGTTLLKGGGRWSRWDPSTDFELVLEAERLLVGRHWEPLLPEPAAAQWRKLLPAGEVDVRAQIVRTASRIEPTISMRCRNVSITHYRFPYRLDRTVGTVVLENSSLSLHLTGQAGGHPVQVDGTFQDVASDAKGFLEVRAEGMGIDEGLLAAMPPRSADIVRSLRAAGTFGFVFRHDRSPDLPGGHANSLGIRLERCSMAYAGFPYPLSGVSGTVRMKDGRWLIRDVSGMNDSGVVRCSGELEPLPDGDGMLELRLTGSRVVLEEELRDSLPAGMRRIWNDVDPRGLVDVKATVRHHVKARSTDVDVEATPHGDTVSIEPAWFPYRLERLAGKLVWEKGLMRFQGVRGVHERTTVATEGTCRFLPDGGWHVAFDELSADHFRPDNELLRALPGGLQEAIRSVRPRGLLSIAGSLDIHSNVAREGEPTTAGERDGKGDPFPDVSAAWDMNLDIEQGTLDVGVPLENVHGGVHLAGRTDGKRWHSQGDLAIDSMIWKGVQVTKVSGPLAIDPDGVRFGLAATPADAARGRRLTAQVAGGGFGADGVVAAGDAGTFRITATLADANLERLAGEWLGTSQRHRGRVQGSIDISGSRAGSHSLSGKGEVRLRDADIYELPLVLALLKMLRIKAPDRNAFGSSFVDFRVEGPRCYLDSIELSGDAISLVGTGELDFDGNTHMTFRSIMGDSETQLPVMKRMLGGASGQFMLIHVDGPLANPELTSEAFPTLNAAIQKLQSQRGDRRAALGIDPLPAAK